MTKHLSDYMKNNQNQHIVNSKSKHCHELVKNFILFFTF